VIRFLLDLSHRSHIGVDEFKSVGMLPVEYRVHQITLNHMYNINRGLAPEYMVNSFQLLDSSHQTRNSTLSYVVPRVNSFGLKSFKYNGVKLWNNLPTHILNSLTILSLDLQCTYSTFTVKHVKFTGIIFWICNVHTVHLL